MDHLKPSLCPAPVCGPARVRWFADLRARIASDAAEQLRRLLDYGYDPEEAAADVLEVWRASLHAQVDLAIDEAQTLGRWAA